MTTIQWFQIKQAAEILLCEKMGPLQITDAQSRVILLWCKETLERQKALDSSLQAGIHLAVYNELPPPNFEPANSVAEFIIEAHRANGWAALSTEQINQLNNLAYLIYTLGESQQLSETKKKKNGWLG